MKKALLILWGAVLLTPIFGGEDWTPFPVGPFGTLNNRDNSYSLPAQNAQDLLNVDITPGGKSVKKRKGYGLGYSLSVTTSPVHGVYDFFDSVGNEISLFFNDTRMSSSVSGATVSVLFSTGPNGATYQCTDSLGYAYCANTSRTTLTKTNGVTYSNIQTVSSTGTMIATCVTRLAMAGFSDRPSGIDLSADSAFTTWGTGSIGTSPVQLTVNAPGARITHITYAFGRLMWFKETSFGFVLIGNQPAQSDWVIKTISYDVGTNDNSSVYREGILYFRGGDGHIYAFDGSSYQRISREISGTTQVSQNRTSNSWTQTSQSDWANGFDITSVFIDTQTVSGNVQLTFPDGFDSLRNGTSGTKNVWQSYCYAFVACSTSVSVSNGNAILTAPSQQDTVLRTTSRLNNYAQGTTYYIVLSSITPNATANQSNFYLVLSSIATTGFNPASLNTEFKFTFTSTGTGIVNLYQVQDSADGYLCNSTCQSTVSALPATIDIYLATNTYQVTVNNVIIKSGSHTFPDYPVHAYLDYFWATSFTTGSAYVDYFGFYPETATYYSAVENAPSLSSWDALVINKDDEHGSNTFYIRSSTMAFALNSSTPTWASVSPGDIPSVSIGSYFQIRDDLAQFGSNNTPNLNDFTQNWFEGNAADKSYATYFNDSILFSVASGTGSSVNNRILKYDLLNQGWLLYDIPVNGFYVNHNNLYFGSSNSGNIFKYGTSDNDNGSAINAYWKSKDFFGGNPFTTQELSNISVSASEVANSSMTITYTLNGSSSTSYSFSLYSSSNMFPNKNKNLPAGTVGSSFNLQFGNNAADQPFEVFGIQIGIRPRSWVPTQ